MQLKNTLVKRGGITAQYWSGSTNSVTAKVSASELNFNFVLPSKGGGKTQIQVLIGLDDLATILPELAKMMPSLAPSLACATHLAVSQLHASSTKKPVA